MWHLGHKHVHLWNSELLPLGGWCGIEDKLLYCIQWCLSHFIHKVFKILQDWIDFHVFQHLFLRLLFQSEPPYKMELQSRRGRECRVTLSNLFLVRMVQRTGNSGKSINYSEFHFCSVCHSVCFSPGFPIPSFPSFPGRIMGERGFIFHASFPKRQKNKNKGEKKR